MEIAAVDNDQDVTNLEGQHISKNQLKKQLKRQKWLEIRREKRKEVKAKRQKRLAEMREQGEDTGPTRKSLKYNTMKNSGCKIKVALDLSLEEYMSEKEIASLTNQIQHSYSSNRRAENPLQLYICGLTGKTKKRLDDMGDYKNWDINVESRDYVEAFPKDSIVYLSSESPNMLSTLSEDKVYVIGGLVDHNSHKGLCHRLAEEKGVTHAQLPIGQYLQLKGRKVLAVNHVFSILLRYTELQDWKQAFLLEMPHRKGFERVDETQPGTECVPHKEDKTCSTSARSKEKTEEPKMEESNDVNLNLANTNKEENADVNLLDTNKERGNDKNAGLTKSNKEEDNDTNVNITDTYNEEDCVKGLQETNKEEDKDVNH